MKDKSEVDVSLPNLKLYMAKTQQSPQSSKSKYKGKRKVFDQYLFNFLDFHTNTRTSKSRVQTTYKKEIRFLNNSFLLVY